MTSVGRQMVNGVRWSALEKGGQQGITFIIFALLARFVAPGDFGLLAMALIVIGFVQLFIDQGFSTAIVQREIVDDEFLSTAFWANLALGVVLGIALIGLKDVPASFFGDPRLAELIPWMALALLFEALMAVPQALMKRNFDFKGLALRTIFARIFAGLVAIVGAVYGWGVWSLVVFTVLSGALSTAILWLLCDWHPKFRFSVRCLRDLLHFGGHVTGVRLLSFVDLRILDVLIGHYFGAVALGYYTLAAQLVGRIGSVIVQVLSQVAMSGFSRVQASAEALLYHVLRVTRITTAIVFPLFALIGLLSGSIVQVLYGSGWEKSALLIGMLAPIAPARVMISSLSDAAMSSGAPNLVLRARILATAIIVPLLLSMLSFGINALILVFMASFYLVTLPTYMAAVAKAVPFRRRSYLVQQLPIVLATVALSGGVLAMSHWSTVHDWIPLWGALISGLVGVTAYCAILWMLDPKTVKELGRLITGMMM